MSERPRDAFDETAAELVTWCRERPTTFQTDCQLVAAALREHHARGKAEGTAAERQRVQQLLYDQEPAPEAAVHETVDNNEWACKVCGNTPDVEGYLDHGKGCYTQHSDGGGTEYIPAADRRGGCPTPAPAGTEPAPLPMVLHCPYCHEQHIDAPEPANGWTNPPHTSHLCHTCGAIFRPAAVPTTGVESIPPGKRDRGPQTPIPSPTVAQAARPTETTPPPEPPPQTCGTCSLWMRLTLGHPSMVGKSFCRVARNFFSDSTGVCGGLKTTAADHPCDIGEYRLREEECHE